MTTRRPGPRVSAAPDDALRRSTGDGSLPAPNDASLLEQRDASLPAAGDPSPLQRRDASPAAGSDLSSGAVETSPGDDRYASPPHGGDSSPEYSCDWCEAPMKRRTRVDRFCSQRCRQAAWRFKQRAELQERYGEPMHLAYADPPYPGHADLYRDQPDYAGEVDHVELVERLQQYDGWALSTSAASLREILPLCPPFPRTRVSSWVKPIGVPSTTYGLHSTWEPLIVVPGRALRPGARDWFSAQPARGGGTLPGRKPLAFCAFLFRALGALPGDELDDLFPGTGIVTRAWREYSRGVCSSSSRRNDLVRTTRSCELATTRRAPLEGTRRQRPLATGERCEETSG